jgi:hypothetical protein
MSVSHTRWLAYDGEDSGADSSNAEVEPGNARHTEVGWSESRTRPCEWKPIDSEADAAGASSSTPSTALPHRTLTTTINGPAGMKMQVSRTQNRQKDAL